MKPEDKPRSKHKLKDRVVLNTPHFSAQIIENEQGIIIDVFHRHGDLIDTYTYWNSDVCDECGLKHSEDNEKLSIKEEVCLRCGDKGEIETEKGFLCNSCDCERLSCLNNTENPKTIDEFWNEVLK